MQECRLSGLQHHSHCGSGEPHAFARTVARDQLIDIAAPRERADLAARVHCVDRRSADGVPYPALCRWTALSSSAATLPCSSHGAFSYARDEQHFGCTFTGKTELTIDFLPANEIPDCVPTRTIGTHRSYEARETAALKVDIGSHSVGSTPAP